MDLTQLPPTVGRDSKRDDVLSNVAALACVTVGTSLLLWAFFHSFTITFDGPLTAEDQRHIREARRLELTVAWPIFAVASALLAVRGRWITAAIFLLIAPTSAAIGIHQAYPVSAFILLAGFVSWATIDRRGMWKGLPTRRSTR